MDGGQHVSHHGDKDDQSKPGVEGHHKVDHGYPYVHKGRGHVEEDVVEEVVHGGGSPVHDPEDLPRLATKVPAEGEVVEVAVQGDLHRPGGVLLHGDPQVAAVVVQEPHAPHGAPLEETEAHVAGDVEDEGGGEDWVVVVVARGGRVGRGVVRQLVGDGLVEDGDVHVHHAARGEEQEAHHDPQLEDVLALGPHVGEDELGLAPEVAEGGDVGVHLGERAGARVMGGGGGRGRPRALFGGKRLFVAAVVRSVDEECVTGAPSQQRGQKG